MSEHKKSNDLPDNLSTVELGNLLETLLRLKHENKKLKADNEELKEFMNEIDAMRCCVCNDYILMSDCNYCQMCKCYKCYKCSEEQFVCANIECENHKNPTRDTWREYYCRSYDNKYCCLCIKYDKIKSNEHKNESVSEEEETVEHKSDSASEEEETFEEKAEREFYEFVLHVNNGKK